MRTRVKLIFALALAAGGLAAVLALSFLRGPAESTESETRDLRVTEVVVASRDLDAGALLASEDVHVVEWPASALPDGYSATPAEVVGRGLLTSVAANEPLLSRKLALKEAGGGLPITIPPGNRAMSVKVDEVIGVAGFVLPGTRVDVLVTLDQMARQAEPRTQLILQNIGVLAAGQTTERDVGGKPKTVAVVTLLVTPEQAEKLALASTNGRVQLALRNTLDLEQVETEGVRASQLIQRPRVVRVSRRRPSRPTSITVEVYKGPDRSTSTVDYSATEEGDEGP